MDLGERNGVGSFSRSMLAFSEFINNLALRDLPNSGAKFTWLNMKEVPCLSKLDRFFLSAEWDFSFPLSKR